MTVEEIAKWLMRDCFAAKNIAGELDPWPAQPEAVRAVWRFVATSTLKRLGIAPARAVRTAKGKAGRKR